VYPAFSGSGVSSNAAATVGTTTDPVISFSVGERD
jgi:hypothetical protein